MMETKRIFTLKYFEYDEKFLELIQTMNKDGWELTKVDLFSTFTKTNQLLKYQIDYTARTEEYNQILYEFIGSMHRMNIFACKDLDAPDLTTDKEIYKINKFQYYPLMSNLTLFTMGIICLALSVALFEPMFHSKIAFIKNAHNFSFALFGVVIGINAFMSCLLDYFKIRALKNDAFTYQRIHRYNMFYFGYVAISTLIMLFVTLSFKNSFIFFVQVLVTQLLTFVFQYLAWFQASKASTNGFRIFVVTLLILAYPAGPSIEFYQQLSVPNNFPNPILVTEVRSSRYIYEIISAEETKDVSWIDDLYMVCLDEDVYDLVFEDFIIQTERGTRSPNTNVFTNTTLEYELSENAVPSLTFEDAFARYEKISDSVWVCEDYLVAKYENLLVRIAFDDLDLAKEKLNAYIHYYQTY